MNTPLRCGCGLVQGELDSRATYARARCYCKDCQAYAHFLGHAQDTLDPHGGTDLVATLPAALRFTAGQEHLACISLTGKGPLRWYAACCRTPIGNTARDLKTPYLGVVTKCLTSSPEALDQAFGPANIALNTSSARGAVRATPLTTFIGVLRIMGHAAAARLSGRYKVNPFFDGQGAPIRAPQALNPDQRRAAYRT